MGVALLFVNWFFKLVDSWANATLRQRQRHAFPTAHAKAMQQRFLFYLFSLRFRATMMHLIFWLRPATATKRLEGLKTHDRVQLEPRPMLSSSRGFSGMPPSTPIARSPMPPPSPPGDASTADPEPDPEEDEDDAEDEDDDEEEEEEEEEEEAEGSEPPPEDEPAAESESRSPSRGAPLSPPLSPAPLPLPPSFPPTCQTRTRLSFDPLTTW